LDEKCNRWSVKIGFSAAKKGNIILDDKQECR